MVKKLNKLSNLSNTAFMNDTPSNLLGSVRGKSLRLSDPLKDSILEDGDSGDAYN